MRGDGQHRGVDVAGDDVHLAGNAAGFGAGHRYRRQFLAGRRCGAPLRSRVLPRRASSATRVWKGVSLAEERTQGSGQRIDEMLSFGAPAVAHADIEAAQAVGQQRLRGVAQALWCRPAADDRLPAVAETGAAVAMEEPVHLREGVGIGRERLRRRRGARKSYGRAVIGASAGAGCAWNAQAPGAVLWTRVYRPATALP